jgi:hypothetical protein
MKILVILSLLLGLNAWSQNLSADEQKQLLNDVKELKNKVNKLESEKSQKGLKTIDYQNSTTESTSAASGPTAPEITPEQSKEIMDTLQRAKAQQEAQAKALKELEDEE